MKEIKYKKVEDLMCDDCGLEYADVVLENRTLLCWECLKKLEEAIQ